MQKNQLVIIDYIKDFECIIDMIDNAVKEQLKNLAHRVSYHSIALNELNTSFGLSRDERKKIFLFLAIYGKGLGVAGTMFLSGVGHPPMPTTLFALLMLIASSDVAPIGVYVQTVSSMRALTYSVVNNDSDIEELKELLSSAYLDKVYAD